MVFNLKKIYPAVISALTLVSANVESFSDCESFQWHPEPEIISVQDCNSTTFSLELLFWRGFSSGLEYGCEMDLNTRWTIGSRLGFCHHFAKKDFNIEAFWTHFYSHANGRKDLAKALWKLYYNTLDVALSREYFADWEISFKPFIGIRSAWIQQNLDLQIAFLCEPEITNNQIFNENLQFLDAPIDQENKENLYGLGPRLGVVANWDTGCGCNLWASLAGNILYGNINISCFDYIAANGAPINNKCCSKVHYQACIAVVDAAIGFEWSRLIKDASYFTLGFAAEHHRFFGYNQMGDYGDLCLDGLTFSCSINF